MSIPQTLENSHKLVAKLVDLGFTSVAGITSCDYLSPVQPATALVKSPLKIIHNSGGTFASVITEFGYQNYTIEGIKVRVSGGTIYIIPDELSYDETNNVSTVYLWSEKLRYFVPHRIRGKLTPHGHRIYLRDGMKLTYVEKHGWVSAPMTSKLVGKYYIPNFDFKSEYYTDANVPDGVIVHANQVATYYTTPKAAEKQAMNAISDALTQIAEQ